MSIERRWTDEQNPNTPLFGLWGCGVLGFWVGLTHILVGMWVCGVLPTSLVRTPEPQNVTTPTASIWGSGGVLLITDYGVRWYGTLLPSREPRESRSRIAAAI